MKLTFKRVEINDKLENVRYVAYNIQSLEILCKWIKKNEYIVYGAYLEIELVGACYIYNAHKLYIEHLFVKKSINL